MLRSPSETLFNSYRRRVLGLLLLRPDESFHVREIARLTGTAAGTLHKELSKLAEAGILVAERRANQLVYMANRASPIYDELASIMRKTSGLSDVIANSIAPCATFIDVAFVFGSVARGEETAHSDIDVMIIGEISFAEIVRQVYAAQATLGREINPKVMSAKEWRASVERKDGFVLDLMDKPKIYVVGNEHDLAKLVGDQP
ncbi:nucleotidyltransferase domain-containing protein [Burkholderia sp. S171]|jgi:predicted nucleotidyltransferase/DNA-binding transcriptional ArsR family regulator|uniref:nucleotidyltransferase domain-containing protein n=1 Tax=Burkholderia sp. S171 TaxID=1641860 RepID=UPI00131ABF56|nr:nucleotidyltransferase domain-containing protein [Burkholderia sp. S171]